MEEQVAFVFAGLPFGRILDAGSFGTDSGVLPELRPVLHTGGFFGI